MSTAPGVLALGPGCPVGRAHVSPARMCFREKRARTLPPGAGAAIRMSWLVPRFKVKMWVLRGPETASAGLNPGP